MNINMEEKILTVSFCGFCYGFPASCNSDVTSSRSYMEKLVCFSKAFCKPCFLEQVIFCNNGKKIGK